MVFIHSLGSVNGKRTKCLELSHTTPFQSIRNWGACAHANDVMCYNVCFASSTRETFAKLFQLDIWFLSPLTLQSSHSNRFFFFTSSTDALDSVISLLVG